jgi:hypothetical protein
MLFDRSDAGDPIERECESSGQAPTAGVGETEGDGDAHRPNGWEATSCSDMILSGEGEERVKDGCRCACPEVMDMCSSKAFQASLGLLE